MGTHSWERNVNLGIFGVSVVDTCNVATKSLTYEANSRVLLCALDEDIINNDLDSRPTIPQSNITGGIASLATF